MHDIEFIPAIMPFSTYGRSPTPTIIEVEKKVHPLFLYIILTISTIVNLLCLSLLLLFR